LGNAAHQIRQFSIGPHGFTAQSLCGPGPFLPEHGAKVEKFKERFPYYPDGPQAHIIAMLIDFARLFGSAVLMSLISGGMAYTMDSMSNNSGMDNTPTMQQEMSSALAAQLGQTTMQLLQKNLNIKPTLEIRPGYQFNVIVTKDLVFQKPYAASR
jgi:hypothetical protein